MDDDRYWVNVESQAKDLISKLLDKNPHTRPNILEVLRHPWLLPKLNEDYSS